MGMAGYSMSSSQEKDFPEHYNLISTTNTDSTITYSNEHFCDVVGYSAEELEGKYHNLVRHPDMPKAAFKDMWDHLKDNKSWMGVVKNRCKNGDYYWVNAYVTPIQDASGKTHEYQSVRTRPSRDDVDRVQKYYHQLNQGILPRALRWPSLSISTMTSIFSIFMISTLLANGVVNGFSLLALLPIPFVCFLWFAVARWAKRLNAIAIVAKDNLKTDITQVLYTGKRDDIAAIELALKMKKAELRAIVGRTGDTCNHILKDAQIDADNIQSVTDNIDSQYSETEQLATAINEMSSSIREVAHSASSTSEQAQIAKETAEQGKTSILSTVGVVNSLHQELTNTKSVINELAADTNQINSILDVITTIADQTNLLALNAAIEAARAGEQGKGFAVVADEIRSLAMKTRKSTEEIHQMISRLQHSADEAVSTMENGARLSEDCRKQADVAGEVFNQINSMLDHVTDASHQIATAVEEQAYVTEDINKSIHNIRELADKNRQSSHHSVDRIGMLVERLHGVVRLINQFQR